MNQITLNQTASPNHTQVKQLIHKITQNFSHFTIQIYYYYFYTLGSKGCRGLKTKVKNVAGMAIGPCNQCRMSRAETQS